MTLLNNDISVIIHTLNEENNIRNCLECVKWADEIVIIDMYSDDRTLEIARQYTDKIFMHERTTVVEPARQFGLNQASKEWILIVDADEIIPVQLYKALMQIAKKNEIDALILPRRNYFFGYQMINSGWGPTEDWQYRFFRRGYVIWPALLHAVPQYLPGARIDKLTSEEHAIIHFAYVDSSHHLEKLNRYTLFKAKELSEQEDLPEYCKKIYEDLRDSSSDGFKGAVISILTDMYWKLTILRYLLIKEYGTSDIDHYVRKKYDSIAQAIIDEYRRI